MKLGSPAFKTLAVGVTLLNCVAAKWLTCKVPCHHAAKQLRSCFEMNQKFYYNAV